MRHSMKDGEEDMSPPSPLHEGRQGVAAHKTCDGTPPAGFRYMSGRDADDGYQCGIRKCLISHSPIYPVGLCPADTAYGLMVSPRDAWRTSRKEAN